MDDRIEVSEELKQLYEILKSLNDDRNINNYYYLRFLTRERISEDYMNSLLNILKKMENKGFKFD